MVWFHLGTKNDLVKLIGSAWLVYVRESKAMLDKSIHTTLQNHVIGFRACISSCTWWYKDEPTETDAQTWAIYTTSIRSINLPFERAALREVVCSVYLSSLIYRVPHDPSALGACCVTYWIILFCRFQQKPGDGVTENSDLLLGRSLGHKYTLHIE